MTYLKAENLPFLKMDCKRLAIAARLLLGREGPRPGAAAGRSAPSADAGELIPVAKDPETQPNDNAKFFTTSKVLLSAMGA